MPKLKACWSALVGLELAASLLAVTSGTAQPTKPGIAITPGPGGVTVTTGPYSWVLSTTAFDVVHAAQAHGQARLTPGSGAITFKGTVETFQRPEMVAIGPDWVELRGWVRKANHLWYVARYQFFDGTPWCRLIVTLTDRHDSQPPRTSGYPGHPYFTSRVIQNWAVRLGVAGSRLTPLTITQPSNWSYSDGTRPWVEVHYDTVEGDAVDPKFHGVEGKPGRFQLVRTISSKAANNALARVIWHPMHAGETRLEALYTGPPNAAFSYRLPKGLVYEVVDGVGTTVASVAHDQGLRDQVVPLGMFKLDHGWTVRLLGHGTTPGRPMVVGPLRVIPSAGGNPFEIPFKERHDGVLPSEGPVSLVVKDFWQHHPISLVRTGNAVGWNAILEPAQLEGGMGLTLEVMISLDGPAGAARAKLYEPPARILPAWVHPTDGSVKALPEYDVILRRFPEIFYASVDRDSITGWRNWGDYTQGPGFGSKAGPKEDWGNLQYDLPYAVLLAWIRTGDPRFWHIAQASVRHLMDIDNVAFYPFMDRQNGQTHRKLGEFNRSSSHTATEPIPDQGFGIRALHLYAALTGERWACDRLRMHVESMALFTNRRRLAYATQQGRGGIWALKAHLIGEQEWPDALIPDPDDRAHPSSYATRADRILDDPAVGMMTWFKQHGYFWAHQYVWAGQGMEALIQYADRRPGRSDIKPAIIAHLRWLLTNRFRMNGDTPEISYAFNNPPIPPYASTHGFNYPKEVWSKDPNYFALWMPSIAWGLRETGDPLFRTWLDRLWPPFQKYYENTSMNIRVWTSPMAHMSLFVNVVGRDSLPVPVGGEQRACGGR